MQNKKLDAAGNVIDDAEKRNDIIQKNLKSVESLEQNQSNDVLGIEEMEIL